MYFDFLTKHVIKMPIEDLNNDDVTIICAGDVLHDNPTLSNNDSQSEY